MQVRSLSYRTDLFFPAFDGSVVDRGDYLVVTTPTNPTYHWGNFLLFARPPRQGDLERWTDTFRREIGDPDRVGHMAFGIDGTAGDAGDAGAVQAFLDAGFTLERGAVLTASTVRTPPRPNLDVEVRPLRTDAEWAQAVDLRVLRRPAEARDEGMATFQRRQMARYRAMASAGWGRWFGAFLAGTMVGDLGVYHRGGVGRFQSVGTHPDYRGRGVASTLVHRAAEGTLREHGVRTLVIVADDGSQAERIYASLGFARVETTVGLSWSAPAEKVRAAG